MHVRAGATEVVDFCFHVLMPCPSKCTVTICTSFLGFSVISSGGRLFRFGCLVTFSNSDMYGSGVPGRLGYAS